jgi:hypothetical protein
VQAKLSDTSLAGSSFAGANFKAAMPVVGFLGSSSAAEWGPFVTAFQRGLKETGFVEGENVTIEYRWADGQYDRLPALAVDCAANCRSTPCSIGVAPCVGSLHCRHQQPGERRDHEQAADRRQQHAADNHAGQRLLHLGADAGGNRGR